MKHRPSPDHDASFSIEFQVDAPLHYSTENDYISRVDGTIFAHSVPRHGSRERRIRIGMVDAFRIHGGRARNDRQSLWDTCDACEQQTADVYQVLFRDGYQFKPVIKRMFPDAISSEVLLIDLVRIAPAYRGRGLGLRAVRRVIDVFEPDGGIVVIKPFPLQFNESQESESKSDVDLTSFKCDKCTSLGKLQRYWAALGFERIAKTEYYAMSPVNASPSMRDLAPE